MATAYGLGSPSRRLPTQTSWTGEHPQTGKQVTAFADRARSVECVAFSPEGQLLATAGSGPRGYAASNAVAILGSVTQRFS
jgi:hypothetical protein